MCALKTLDVKGEIMKKINLAVLLLVMALGVAGCTKQPANTPAPAPAPVPETSEIKEDVSQAPEDPAGTETQSETPAGDVITDDQALSAIKTYCYANNPDLESMEQSGEYEIYWSVESSSENEIVVLFRSYTAAQIRYYIDPKTGDTYVTELVPGIIDEEQKTDETLNVRDYL